MSQQRRSDAPSTLRSMTGQQVTKNTRLPSLRSPRDLTLGGSGSQQSANKRKFTPNIKAAGSRPISCVETARSVQGPGRGGVETPNRAVSMRGRLKHGPETIQSQGIFSSGLGKREVKQSTAGGGGLSHGPTIKQERGEESVNNSMSRGLYSANKGEVKLETEDILQSLLDNKAFISDLKNDSEFGPVSLPFPECKQKSQIVKKEVDSEEADLPKELRVDASEDKCNRLKGLGALRDNELLLMQFVDVLPIEATTSVSDTTASSASPNESALSDVLAVERGYLGKLRVRRSGQASLSIGTGHQLSVKSGAPCSFLQDVVSIDKGADPSVARGYSAVIGHIHMKLTVTPTLDAMFD